MLSKYSEIDKDRAVLTLQSIAKTIDELIAWNNFELDADLVFEAVKEEIPTLKQTIAKAIGDINAKS